MQRRHAEIAGGGIGGLGLGMMLARNGWSVRIHERSPVIREIGAGISLRNNCINVLEHYGIFERFKPHGTTLQLELSVDREGRVLQRRDLRGAFRTHVMPRQMLVELLAEAAREAGADIVTDSQIVGADSAGALIDAGGRHYAGDLVVAADGVGSRIRDGAGIGAFRVHRATRVNRYLLPTREITAEDTMYEHWSEGRRVGIMPSGPGKTFVYLVMPEADKEAAAFPMNPAAWTRTFPQLASAFDLIAQEEGTQYPYQVVTCPRWSTGRLAFVGDAAHGMPPTLGQGAGLTMLNSHALALAVSGAREVPDALRNWEQSVRFITDATQRWSVRYDQFTRHFPLALRPAVLWAFGKFKSLNERMRIADKGLSLIEAKLSP